MHSLLCCGIFRVPSPKKKLYKTFVEIVFSHAHYVQSHFGHGWVCITIQTNKQ